MTPPPVQLVAPADVDAAVARIRASREVAIDTEFHAENRYLPDLYLVQLGLDDGCLLIDPLVPGVLAAVGPALRERPWLVHGGEHDLRLLDRALGGPPLAGVFDTQIAAGLVTTGFPTGYAALCATFLGHAVDKGETLSDWSRRPLSPAQLAYAARDVAHLAALADVLRARLSQSGRTAIADAALAEAVDAALTPSPDRWLAELVPNTSFDARQAAVLRALLGWRDERATAQNVPPRVIAGDGILLDLARRLPETAAQVTASRRFPRNLGRTAPELVDVVSAALATPPETWPTLVRRGTAAARRSAFLQLWAQVQAEREGWAASLVLPREAADRVALGQPLSPWRRTLLEPHLDHLASGAIALALDPVDVSTRPVPGT